MSNNEPIFYEERLSEEKHFKCVGDFCCGADSPLDTFLNSEAFEYDRQRYGNTYVLTASEKQAEILGFYTLKTSAIQTEEEIGIYKEYNSIPVVEIARIALQYDLQGQGLGKLVFHDHILPKIRRVSELVAVNAIIAFVDPEDRQAIHYYKSMGFNRAEDVVQNKIGESFNEECDLYMVSLNELENQQD